MRWSSAAKVPSLIPPPQRGLADEEAAERTVGVHVGVDQQRQLLELFGDKQVRLVDDEHHEPAAFAFHGGEGVGGLRDDRGMCKRGTPPSADAIPA